MNLDHNIIKNHNHQRDYNTYEHKQDVSHWASLEFRPWSSKLYNIIILKSTQKRALSYHTLTNQRFETTFHGFLINKRWSATPKPATKLTSTPILAASTPWSSYAAPDSPSATTVLSCLGHCPQWWLVCSPSSRLAHLLPPWCLGCPPKPLFGDCPPSCFHKHLQPFLGPFTHS
jgi:hypothetical protein